MRRFHRSSCALMALLIQASGVIAQPAPNDATTVSDLEVKAPEQVPVPEVGIGAPLFTVPELEAVQIEARKQAQEALTQARGCDQDRGQRTAGNFLVEYDAATSIRGSAELAVEATRRSDEVRRAAARGQATQKEVEDAELARQAQVRRLVFARAVLLEAQAVTADLQKLESERPKLEHCVIPQRLRGMGVTNRIPDKSFNGIKRQCQPEEVPDPASYPTSEEWAFANQGELAARARARQYASGQRIRQTPPEFADLALEDLVVREQNDGEILVVSGAIRNPRTLAIDSPPLSFTVLDRFGFPLKSELADPGGRAKIQAGRTLAFRYQIRPRPSATDTVLVTFGSDEYEPWRLPGAAVRDCPVLPFPMPKPTEGVLPSPRDPTPTTLRPKR